MQRVWVLLLVVGIGCSDDDRNKTTPDTALVETPAALTNEKHVRILFEARGNANSFFCTLDGNTSQCVSPFEADVVDGEHTFEVAAALNANVDETPAMHAWRVDTATPDTTITNAPPALDNAVAPVFTFTGNDGSTARHAGTVTFECKVDSGAFAACSSPHTVNAIDGIHSFSVRAKDEAGNVDPTPAEHGWTIDSTAPETTITTGPSAGATSGPSGSFGFDSPDATATFECAFDGGAFVACVSPQAFTLGDGAHTFAVRAKDTVGIVDPSPATRAWNVDASPPSVTITATPTNPSNQTQPMFSFTSPDATATFQCQVDGVVAFAACTSPFTSPALTDGNQTFRVRATDTFANVGTPATHAWLVDLIAPTVTITAEPATLSNDDTPSVTFTTAGSPMTTQCRVDAGAFANCTSPFTSSSLGDGTHTISVRVTDAATNFSIATTNMFTIDTMAPTVTINTQPAALTNDDTPTVTFTTAGSPMFIQCRVDSGAFASCTSPFTTTVTEGTHTISVRVIDAATNSSTATTNMFTVDLTPPTVALNTQPAALSNDDTPSVTFTTGGSPSMTRCQLDSGALATCVSPFTTTAADGNHTITVRVDDAAGNFATATTASFTVDTMPPTVTINTQPAALSNDDTPTVTFTTTGNPTGIDCRVDTGAFAPCSSPFTTTVAEGTHTITIRATDGATNNSSATTNNFTVDLTPPTVTINTQPAALSNDSTPTVTFTTAGNTTTMCRVDTGAFAACTSPFTTTVLDGNHTITVRVDDAAGNFATATTNTFTVDTAGPVMAFTEQAPAQWPVNYFDFAFTVGDSVTVTCSLDGAAFTACTSPSTQTFSYNVAHQFSVRGTDNANNSTTITSGTFTPVTGMVLHYAWEQGNAKNTSLLKQVQSHSPNGPAAGVSPFVGGWAGSAIGSAIGAHTYARTDRPLMSSTYGNYTLSFWVRATSAADATRIIDTVGTAGSVAGVRFSLGSNVLTVTSFEGGNSATNTTSIPVDQWVNISARTTGPAKGLEVFVDGNARFSIPSFSGFGPGVRTNMLVGNFTGMDLDDLRFYNRSFATAQHCTLLARGQFDGNGSCHSLSPGFEIDFEGGRVADTGSFNLALAAPQAGSFAFIAHTLGDMFRLLSVQNWGYAIGGPSFGANANAFPTGRSLSFEFVPGAVFGRIIDTTIVCNAATGGGGMCGVLVSYPDNNGIAIYTGTPTQQITTTIGAAGGLQPNRFNTVVITEQRDATGSTTQLTVFVNGVKTTIPISGGNLFNRVRDDVRLVQVANLQVDEYEFWQGDLQTNLEMLCENGFDGEFDIVSNTCSLTAGP